MKNIIIINKVYRLEVEKNRYRLVKITNIRPTHIEAYFLDNPSQAIGIANKECLFLYIAELEEINKIKEQDLPKIDQNDINDMLIDLHIKEREISK